MTISQEIPRPKGQAILFVGQGHSRTQVLQVAVAQTEHDKGSPCGKSLSGWYPPLQQGDTFRHHQHESKRAWGLLPTQVVYSH